MLLDNSVTDLCKRIGIGVTRILESDRYIYKIRQLFRFTVLFYRFNFSDDNPLKGWLFVKDFIRRIKGRRFIAVAFAT